MWLHQASAGPGGEFAVGRSGAICMIPSHIWFWAVWCGAEGDSQAGCPDSPDAVLGPGVQPVTELELEFGDRSGQGVGGETGQPHAVRIREPQLRSRGRLLLPIDQPHALGPAVHDKAGGFSDPGTATDLAVRLDGWSTGRYRNLQHVLEDCVITMPTETE